MIQMGSREDLNEFKNSLIWKCLRSAESVSITMNHWVLSSCAFHMKSKYQSAMNNEGILAQVFRG